MNAIRDWMDTLPHWRIAPPHVEGLLSAFRRLALAGNRFAIDWQAFMDRFGMPRLYRPLTRYQRRRLESLRNRSNRATQWGKRTAWDGSVARTRLPRWCVTWGHWGKVNRRRVKQP
jgi:hypothetical protein